MHLIKSFVSFSCRLLLLGLPKPTSQAVPRSGHVFSHSSQALLSFVSLMVSAADAAALAFKSQCIMTVPPLSRDLHHDRSTVVTAPTTNRPNQLLAVSSGMKYIPGRALLLLLLGLGSHGQVPTAAAMRPPHLSQRRNHPRLLLLREIENPKKQREPIKKKNMREK